MDTILFPKLIQYICIYVLIFNSREGTGACNVPSALQGSTWTYTKSTSLPYNMTFTANEFQGFDLRAQGTPIQDYRCLINDGNRYVFKGTTSYTDKGQTRYIYMCMKITKISNNLFYFYLLNDIDTEVSPTERVYNPPHMAVAPDNEPISTYCTSCPPDSDVRVLQKTSTSETLPSSVSCPDPVPENSSPTGLSSGVIAGIVVAVLLTVTATTCLLGIYFFKLKERPIKDKDENQQKS